ncbi:lactonase family protein [Burkholderia guangdongensis]|uniref:lactonase family protein n=1 Tax=Burkholderia guangdongensis TaxID=1792500 RepID=UPI0015CBA4CE|nr:beta-propeller fold lactonase family protein [Burkholderia guangdongensis]
MPQNDSRRVATYVYVSNADSEDISVFRIDRPTGALDAVQTVAVGGTVMPMALSPDRRRLYAGLRSAPYRVSTFGIDPRDGRLTLLGQAPLAGNIAYLSTDATGRYLFSASYGGNLVAVNRVDADGVAGPVHQVVGTGPMAHAIRATADNRYVYASILGADTWLRFGFDPSTGHLAQDGAFAYRLPPQSGPRHFVFSADRRFAYVLGELDGNLHVLALASASVPVAPVQRISILPPGFAGARPWAADLHLTPDGRFLYASERTSSTLAAYRVDPASGRLTHVASCETEAQPRGFNIDPSGNYLLAVGQLSTRMSVYRIDRETGALQLLARYPVGRNPNWIEIVALEIVEP